MKTLRILRLSFLVMFAVSLVLMLHIPPWLRLQKGNVAKLEDVAFLSLQNNDLVEGKISYVLGCAAAEQNGIWSTELYSEGKKRYYVLWQPSGQMILYATNDANEQLWLEQITTETQKFAESAQIYWETGDYEDLVPPVTTLQMQGVVSRLPDDVAEQFAEWCNQQNADYMGNCNTMVYISHTGFHRYKVLSLMGIICLGGSLALGCALLFAEYRRKKQAHHT